MAETAATATPIPITITLQRASVDKRFGNYSHKGLNFTVNMVRTFCLGTRRSNDFSGGNIGEARADCVALKIA